MKTRVKRHAVIQPLDTSYRLIPLTKGQNALVDADDFEWLSRWNWHAERDYTRGCFYAKWRTADGEIFPMASIIIGCGKGEVADHINGDSLDNRKENLRKATISQNGKNRRVSKRSSSGYNGVYKQNKKWRVAIYANGQRYRLGSFTDKEEAARIWDKAARKYFGEFAHLNFPPTE